MSQLNVTLSPGMIDLSLHCETVMAEQRVGSEVDAGCIRFGRRNYSKIFKSQTPDKGPSSVFCEEPSFTSGNLAQKNRFPSRTIKYVYTMSLVNRLLPGSLGFNTFLYSNLRKWNQCQIYTSLSLQEEQSKMTGQSTDIPSRSNVINPYFNFRYLFVGNQSQKQNDRVISRRSQNPVQLTVQQKKTSTVLVTACSRSCHGMEKSRDAAAMGDR